MTSAKQWLRGDAIFAALAVMLLSYRFANLDLVTFINDEPHLLEAAEHEAHGGAWVTASPVAGTQGLHYGPVPTWFYGVIHLIFGASPLVSIVAMGIVVTLGQLIFAFMLARSIDGGARAFGIVVLLVAASPFDFAWSRTAWDNTILIGTFSCAALLLAEDELTTKKCLVAGTLFGLALGSHLMVLPALVALFGVTLWQRRSDLKITTRKLAVVSAPALLVNLPYLYYLLTRPLASASSAASAPAMSPPHAFSITEAIGTVVLTFLQPARILTLDGVQYFFDEAWRDFGGWLGGASFFLHDAWWALLLAGFAFAGLWLTARRDSSARMRRLATLALAAWMAHAFFLLVDGLDPHPHYQHPIWWTIPTGIVLLLRRIETEKPQLSRAVLGFVVVSSAAHFAFLPMWMRYVRERGGTRFIHFTTVLPEEETFVRQACAVGPHVDIENRTAIFSSALGYLIAHEPACAGHTMNICGGTCLPSEDARTVTLSYAGVNSAHLAPP